MIIFGEHKEWGISVDDGCLQFHPNILDDPKIKADHIWAEAWDEVEKHGGFKATIQKIYQDSGFFN